MRSKCPVTWWLNNTEEYREIWRVGNDPLVRWGWWRNCDKYLTNNDRIELQLFLGRFHSQADKSTEIRILQRSSHSLSFSTLSRNEKVKRARYFNVNTYASVTLTSSGKIVYTIDTFPEANDESAPVAMFLPREKTRWNSRGSLFSPCRQLPSK